MSGLAAHKRHPTRAAYGDGGVVICEGRPLGDKVLLQGRHIVQRVVMIVLVIGEDENNIGFACCRSCKKSRGKLNACDAGARYLHGEQRLVT